MIYPKLTLFGFYLRDPAAVSLGHGSGRPALTWTQGSGNFSAGIYIAMANWNVTPSHETTVLNDADVVDSARPKSLLM